MIDFFSSILSPVNKSENMRVCKHFFTSDRLTVMQYCVLRWKNANKLASCHFYSQKRGPMRRNWSCDLCHYSSTRFRLGLNFRCSHQWKCLLRFVSKFGLTRTCQVNCGSILACRFAVFLVLPLYLGLENNSPRSNFTSRFGSSSNIPPTTRLIL